MLFGNDQRMLTPGNDLFYNKTNGKFMLLYHAQADAPAHVEDGVIKYTNAKTYYFAWLNPDGVELGQFKPDKVFNSPVIRTTSTHQHYRLFEIGLFR